METLQSEPKTLRAFLNRHVTGIDILASVLIVLLVMSNVFGYTSYKELQKEYVEAKSKQVALKTNTEVLGFTRMFIEKVLKADGEIDFDTRIKLESTVRDLEDDEILAVWEDFTNSQTEQDAQGAVKRLLSALVDKIQ